MGRSFRRRAGLGGAAYLVPVSFYERADALHAASARAWLVPRARTRCLSFDDSRLSGLTLVPQPRAVTRSRRPSRPCATPTALATPDGATYRLRPRAPLESDEIVNELVAMPVQWIAR